MTTGYIRGAVTLKRDESQMVLFNTKAIPKHYKVDYKDYVHFGANGPKVLEVQNEDRQINYIEVHERQSL